MRSQTIVLRLVFHYETLKELLPQ